MALFRNFGVNHAKDVTGLVESLVRPTGVCLRAILDFLELAENCSFLDRKLISALNETVDGH